MVRSSRFLKGQITKAANRTVEHLTACSVYRLNEYMNDLNTEFAELKAHFSEQDISDDNEDEVLNEFKSYEEKYYASISLLRENIDIKLERDPNESMKAGKHTEETIQELFRRQGEFFENCTNRMNNKRQDLNMPRIKIPFFSGGYSEWTPFKNLFENIVIKNREIGEVEKLYYLRSSVKGEAAGVIQHFDLVRENFQAAWNALESRYDKPFKIICSLIDSVMKSDKIRENRSNLRQTCTLLNVTIRILDSLGDYAKTRDPWIIKTFMLKLDEETIDHWARAHSQESEPSVSDFLKFLDSECDTLDLRKPFATKFERTSVKSMSSFLGHCFVCSGSHKIFECEKFAKMNVSEREKIVKLKQRCLNCLGTGHYIKSCQSKSSCSYCRRRHHSLLHKNEDSRSSTASDSFDATRKSAKTIESPQISTSDSFIKLNANVHRNSGAILPTALIRIPNAQGGYVICRALLDSGSQASFISEACFSKLGVNRLGDRVPISAFSSSSCFYSKGSIGTSVFSIQNPEEQYGIKLHILQKLTDSIPDRMSSFKKAGEIKSGFALADTEFDKPAKIDVVLGADVVFNLIGPSKYYCPADNLWILQSSLGWLVSGGSDMPGEDGLRVNSACLGCSDSDLDNVLEKFWKVEEPQCPEFKSEEDEQCEKLFSSTTSRDADGRYSVHLPIRNGVELGDSFELALKRFFCLEKRFQRDTEYYENYLALFKEFQSKGYLEKVPDEDLDVPVCQRYFLPHHGIVRKSSDGPKMRIVFDASLKSNNGVSLNDLLMTGPNLQKDIFEILIRFRLSKYVFTADIIKMYRQITVHGPHRNFQRLIWRSEKTEKIEQWRLTTVSDGESVSPWLALRVLRQLSCDEKQRCPLGSEALQSNYMDDFIVGADSLESLIAKRRDLEAILGLAKMNLSKFASNDARILIGIPQELRINGKCVKIEETKCIKMLGISWNPHGDYFTFSFDHAISDCLTKRSFLSLVSRIYDPMGWLSPITIKLKIIFQSIWIAKLGWDDELPSEMRATWNAVEKELKEGTELQIPRHLALVETIEIHGFCDASTAAYAGVIYLKSMPQASMPTMRLLASKTRVAPIKPMTIARLELCGALLVSKLMSRVIQDLKHLKFRVVCWSDSTTVLAWLSGSSSRWTTFVANRCAQVHELLPDAQWRYVRSAENPADVASRGINPRALIGFQLWWSGPSLLKESCGTAPTECFATDSETRKIVMTTTITDNLVNDMINRFSSYDKLRRSLAFVLRYVYSLKTRETHDSVMLATSEIDRSTKSLIRAVQEIAFRAQKRRLQDGKPIREDDPLFTLSPILDEFDIMRVGGRMNNVPCTYDRKHPIIIPKCHLAELIVDHVHVKYYHSGVKLTFSIIRSQMFVVGLKRIVKQRISSCMVCKRYRAQTYQPQLGQIPGYRFALGKPFSVTGVDFAGPFTVRPFRSRGNLSTKSYVTVFVCMTTRAVHLELAFGLHVDSLIMCLKRFVARRGRCKVMLSDNGRNFLGCSRLMKEYNRAVVENIDDVEVRKFLVENLIEWKFIPVYSPHFGGLWESVVKSFKFHLIRAIGGQTLVIEEFTTVLSQVESILNSRPLVSELEGCEEQQILTPAHLLSGFPSVEFPLLSDNINNAHISDGKRFNNLSTIVRSFWMKWRNEYYNQLSKKNKWGRVGREPVIGELVLIKRNLDPPTFWRKGVIEKLFKGTDGIVRVVDVRTSSSIRREAARNLIPLSLKSTPSTGEL